MVRSILTSWWTPGLILLLLVVVVLASIPAPPETPLGPTLAVAAPSPPERDPSLERAKVAEAESDRLRGLLRGADLENARLLRELTAAESRVEELTDELAESNRLLAAARETPRPPKPQRERPSPDEVDGILVYQDYTADSDEVVLSNLRIRVLSTSDDVHEVSYRFDVRGTDGRPAPQFFADLLWKDKDGFQLDYTPTSGRVLPSDVTEITGVAFVPLGVRSVEMHAD